jgi:hypothetical protein
MHKGHYSDDLLARFLGGFARTIAIFSFVFGVSVKVITYPRNDYLADHPT